MKKIALLADGWRRYVTYSWVEGIMEGSKELGLDVCLYFYNTNGTWSANGKNQEFGMKVEKGTPIDSKDRIAEKILEGMRKANSYKGSDSRNLYLYYQTDKEDLCLVFAPN